MANCSYCYQYERLKAITQTLEGQKVVEDFKRVYNEKFANQPIPTYNYSYIKLYYQTGDRNQHQALYFNRRSRLTLLQVLALADDAYLDDLENILAAICDEFTWVLPAHSLDKTTNTYNYEHIDLLAAETGLYLSETAYVFGDKLSADIRKRISLALQRHIVDIYESKSFAWEQRGNNWTAVCAGAVGATYLYAFPQRFDGVKQRIVSSMNSYLNGFDDEGYSSEGIAYWLYGFGFFSIFFDIYNGLKGEKHPLSNSEKVKKVLQYFHNAKMDENVFLPFADGGRTDFETNPFYFYTMKNLFQDDFDLPTLSMAKPEEKAFGFRLLNGVHAYGVPMPKPNQTGTAYYQNSQVFIHKNARYSFAAKGGHNQEFHNHNDVGSFQIVKDGKRLLVDLGPGEYTYGYFNIPDDSFEGRYGDKIFVCGSKSHGVPIVNGCAQAYGKAYYGEVLEQSDTRFTVQLKNAYPTKMQSLIVSYAMEKESVRAKYRYEGVNQIVFRFVSTILPRLQDGNVVIDVLTIVNHNRLQPVVNRVDYSGSRGVPSHAYTIDYTVEDLQDMQTEFSFIL